MSNSIESFPEVQKFTLTSFPLNDVSGSVMLVLVSGLCPKLFGDERDAGNNPQVELMMLCSVSMACSAVFLAEN